MKSFVEGIDHLSALLLENSAEFDQLIGFKITEIEAELLERARHNRPDGHLWSLGQGIHGGSQTWVGLDPQTLQTPYAEMKEMFDLIAMKGNETVVDLGAGYGRTGVLLHIFYPEVKFTGYELVSERVIEGNRVLSLMGAQGLLITADLTSDNFVFPIADIYFIYDFGEVAHIRKILNKLGEMKHPFRLIARGKGTRSLVDLEQPWLADVHPVIRRENFAIYANFGE